METNPLQTGAQSAVDDQGLRPIEWPVLRARLGAAFELRGAMANRRSVSRGNFARFAAAAGHLNEMGAGVNRDGLADRKRDAIILPDMANEAPSGDREYT